MEHTSRSKRLLEGVEPSSKRIYNEEQSSSADSSQQIENSNQHPRNKQVQRFLVNKPTESNENNTQYPINKNLQTNPKKYTFHEVRPDPMTSKMKPRECLPELPPRPNTMERNPIFPRPCVNNDIQTPQNNSFKQSVKSGLPQNLLNLMPNNTNLNLQSTGKEQNMYDDVENEQTIYKSVRNKEIVHTMDGDIIDARGSFQKMIKKAISKKAHTINVILLRGNGKLFTEKYEDNNKRDLHINEQDYELIKKCETFLNNEMQMLIEISEYSMIIKYVPISTM